MDATRHTGGCLCGSLRYEAEGEPLAAGHCYCADCRKASGSGFIGFMRFPASAVRLTGPSQPFTSKAANGNDTVRNFCPTCGGLVFGGERDQDDTLNIYAGSLDDPTGFRPTIAVFTQGRPDWTVVPEGMEVFERGC